MLENMNISVVSSASELSYLVQYIPPSLCDEHPAAVQTRRRAIYQEFLGS